MAEQQCTSDRVEQGTQEHVVLFAKRQHERNRSKEQRRVCSWIRSRVIKLAFVPNTKNSALQFAISLVSVVWFVICSFLVFVGSLFERKKKERKRK